LDPKAAIELGQKSFLTFPYLAASRELNKDVMLICCVFKGSTSPLADNNAAKLYISVGLCFYMTLYKSCLFKMSNFSWILTLTLLGGSRISAQMTLLGPILLERARISYWPTWPYAPAINTFITYKYVLF